MPLLLVEPDLPLASFLHSSLEAEGYQVVVAHGAAEAQQLIPEITPEIILLDLEMQFADTASLLRHVKANWPEIRILAITASAQSGQQIEALDSGADDCVTKPFRFAELAAHIRALLRRPMNGAQSLLRIADLELDRTARKVLRGTREIELTVKEFALLEYLMLHAGHPVSRANITHDVWKLTFQNNTNVVDVYINYLRKKIDRDSALKLIHTVRGTGYQLSSLVPGFKPEALHQPHQVNMAWGPQPHRQSETTDKCEENA